MSAAVAANPFATGLLAATVAVIAWWALAVMTGTGTRGRRHDGSARITAPDVERLLRTPVVIVVMVAWCSWAVWRAGTGAW